MVALLKPVDDSPLGRVREAARQYTGRRVGKAPGSHVADLVALQKMITLCNSCAPKFDPKRNGYTECHHAPLNNVLSDCDACRAYMVDCAAFIHEGS